MALVSVADAYGMRCPMCGVPYYKSGWEPLQWEARDPLAAQWSVACRICTMKKCTNPQVVYQHWKILESAYHELLATTGFVRSFVEFCEGGSQRSWHKQFHQGVWPGCNPGNVLKSFALPPDVALLWIRVFYFPFKSLGRKQIVCQSVKVSAKNAWSEVIDLVTSMTTKACADWLEGFAAKHPYNGGLALIHFAHSLQLGPISLSIFYRVRFQFIKCVEQ